MPNIGGRQNRRVVVSYTKRGTRRERKQSLCVQWMWVLSGAPQSADPSLLLISVGACTPHIVQRVKTGGEGGGSPAHRGRLVLNVRQVEFVPSRCWYLLVAAMAQFSVLVLVRTE